MLIKLSAVVGLLIIGVVGDVSHLGIVKATFRIPSCLRRFFATQYLIANKVSRHGIWISKVHSEASRLDVTRNVASINSRKQ